MIQMSKTNNYCKQTWETKSDIKKLHSVVVCSRFLGFYQSSNLTCSKFRSQNSKLATLTIDSNPPFAYVHRSESSLLPFWLYSFAIVSSYCFTPEIQELTFVYQTLTTSWHHIQFPSAYLGRPFCQWWLKTVSYFTFHHWGSLAMQM